MKDSEIEDLLQRYRPIGPPARLRERILAIDRTERIWPWATAAAALLVCALTFRIATGYEAASVDVRLGPAAATRVADDLTDRLGGDAEARALAEFILVEQQVRAEAIGDEPQ
ncbi:MAG: hypothetical protein Q7J25_08290 [Vicinamibacterales bacterium]|nr:hypothetical protein [Vicinamibacterales bacterium]